MVRESMIKHDCYFGACFASHQFAGHDVPHTTHTTARENYEMCGLDWIGPTDLFICLNWRGNEIVWFENIRYKVRKLIL